MRKLFFFISLFVLGIMQAFGQTKADAIIGTWFTEDRDLKVTIYKERERYFGRIVWIKQSSEANQNPVLDRLNPDESLRTKPLLGVLVLREFVFDEDDSDWQDGVVYDPRRGRESEGYIELKNSTTIKVGGFHAFRWMGHSDLWTKVQ